MRVPGGTGDSWDWGPEWEGMRLGMEIRVEKRRVPRGREVRGTPRGGGPDVPTCSASGPGAASPARRNPRLKKRRSAMRSRGTIPAPSRHHPGPAHPRTARGLRARPRRDTPRHDTSDRDTPRTCSAGQRLRGAPGSEDGWGLWVARGSDITLQPGVGVPGMGWGSRGWSRCGNCAGMSLLGIGRGSGVGVPVWGAEGGQEWGGGAHMERG